MRSFFILLAFTLYFSFSNAQSYLAAVKIYEDWGFIDEKGQWFIEPTFEGAKNFVEDIALVKVNGDWQYINLNKELISKDKTYKVKHFFSDGLARVIEKNKWGYIDKNGEYVISPIYEKALDFKNGLAPVMLNNLWGFINKKGEFVIKPQYLGAKEFENNIGTVLDNKGYKYVNRNLEIFPTNKEYEVLHYFVENLAPVKKNKKWGFIDTTGNFIIEPVFEEVDYFSEGLAAVKYKGKWGYILTSGEWYVNPVFDFAKKFKDGMGLVKEGKIYYYVNKQNQIIGKDSPLELRHYFSDGRARVKHNTDWGFINKECELVVPFQFYTVKDFKNGLAAVKKNYLWGFINTDGELVIDFQFDDIEYFTKINL